MTAELASSRVEIRWTDAVMVVRIGLSQNSSFTKAFQVPVGEIASVRTVTVHLFLRTA